MADSLSLAMLVLLESLSPEQRAVLLLHDVFDYDYPTRSPRSSARARTTSASSPRAPDATSSSAGRASRPPASSATSWHAGSSPPPSKAISPDSRRCWLTTCELTGDGGGKVPALARTLRGRNRVARTLINWMRLGARLPGVSLRPVEVNGGPGALCSTHSSG